MAIEFYTNERPYVVWKTKLYDPVERVSPSFTWDGYTCHLKFTTFSRNRSEEEEEWRFTFFAQHKYSAVKERDAFDYTIYLMDRNGLIHTRNLWLWSEFEIQTIIQKDDFKVNGIFVLVCVFEHRKKIQTITSLQARMDTGRRSASAAFALNIQKMLVCDEFSDVVLNCQDRIFHVHRNILSTRSEVFDAMFRHEMSENRDRVVAITDIQPDILDLFLKYIYSGSLDVKSVNIAMDLYRAADKYAVTSLKCLCSTYLRNKAADEDAANVKDILELAYMYGDPELKEAASLYVK